MKEIQYRKIFESNIEKLLKIILKKFNILDFLVVFIYFMTKVYTKGQKGLKKHCKTY